jgi:chaperonin GroES
MNIKITPLHDRLVIQRTPEELKSKGGIVIPDTAAEKPSRGKVIALGSGKLLDNGQVRPLALKLGDNVLFGKYSGTEIEVEGEKLVVLREEDVLAVIKD